MLALLTCITLEDQVLCLNDNHHNKLEIQLRQHGYIDKLVGQKILNLLNIRVKRS